MKKKIIFVCVFIMLSVCTAAVVYDFSSIIPDSFETGFNAQKKGALKGFINGRKAVFSRYITAKDQGDVIGYYLALAKEKKFEIIDNAQVMRVAGLLLSMSNSAAAQGFDYVLYSEKGRLHMVAAENNPGGTVVIVFEAENISKGRPCVDDGLRHISGAVRITSIEIPGAGFANFYRLAGANPAEVINYYAGAMQRDRWEIIYKGKEELIAGKGKRQYILSFSDGILFIKG